MIKKNKLIGFLEKYKRYIISFFFLIIFFFIFKQYLFYKEIKDNKEETIGYIINIRYRSRGAYSVKYIYYVQGEKHENSIGTSGFYGNNKRKGCVGCKFPVYYSSKDPTKSSIRLGKYEKFKRTCEFGLFDKKTDSLVEVSFRKKYKPKKKSEMIFDINTNTYKKVFYETYE